MDHLFTVTKKSVQISPFIEAKNVASISTRNIIAFTSYTDFTESPNPKTWIPSVYVSDLNVPHEIFKVTSLTEDVTCLEWDQNGNRLLIGDATGGIQVWTPKDNIIREWVEVNLSSTNINHKDAFPGEPVMIGCWFHDGVKVVFSQSDVKKESIFDKFSRKTFNPSSRQFGQKPSDGLMVISASGLVFCVIFLPDGSIVSGLESLRPFRHRVEAIDICHHESGNFLVATSNGSSKSPINCFIVKVSTNGFQDKTKVTINCESFYSFFLTAATVEKHPNISHVKFASKEDSESVIIATSGPTGSTVELWKLKDKEITLHKFFKKKEEVKEEEPVTVKEEPKDEAMDTTEGPEIKKEEEEKPKEQPPASPPTPPSPAKEQPQEKVSIPPTMKVWTFIGSCSHSYPVVSLSVPRIWPFDQSCCPSLLLSVAFADNTIKIYIQKDGDQLSEVSCHTISKKSSKGSPLLKICQTSLSSNSSVLLVITTTSELHAFRLLNIFEGQFSHSNLLAYCLLLNRDYWDLLVTFKSSSLDSTFEILSNASPSLPVSIQAKLLPRLLVMKGCLYRILPARSTSSLGQVKSGDAFAALTLQAVSTFLKSLFRVRDNQEKEGPVESLSNLINTRSKDKGVDKVMMELEPKDFFVEASILQSLQNLNQWVADLALYLLSSLPYQQHKNYRFPGGSLIHDLKSINLLRELFVVMRIWGLVTESCLPLFTKLNGDLDVISHLFRLLNLRINSLSSSEPDEGLLNECYLLPNQVLVNQPLLNLRARGVASPILFNPTNSLPFNLVFTLNQRSHQQTQQQLELPIKTHVIEGAVMYNLNRRLDVVRQVILGTLATDDSKLRHCTRCKSVSLFPFQTRSLAIRAWDLRFTMRCPCSGSWS